MDILAIPFILLIKSIVALCMWFVLADVILSWLVTMSILNTSNRFVFSIVGTLSRISSFLLNPVRKMLPVNFGSIDISPIVFILFLTFVENIVNRILLKIS